MAFFLSTFFKGKAQNKQSISPPEKFSVVEAKLSNGKPVIGSFNMGYKNYGLKNRYPWCLTINMGLDLKHVTDNGLPTKAESDIANKFEDKLIADIKKITTIHYIGHLYNDTFLDIYAYVDNPEKVNKYLQSQVNKKGLIRGFAFKMQKDTNWDMVKMFLK
jgi:hypothetical protein